MLGKDTGKEAGAYCIGGFPGKQATQSILFCLSIHSHHHYSHCSGTFYKGEKNPTHLGSDNEEKSEHSFLLSAPLLGKGGWSGEKAELRRGRNEKTRHEIPKPTTIPHTNGVLSPNPLQRGQKEPRNVSVPFQGPGEL